MSSSDLDLTTDAQSRYWADCLTLLNPHESYEGLARSIASARVDLNPHQVDAALFAFRSPLSHGVLLADEVGLGKTIEAGIVLLQFWAERRRRLLLILPASLRSQWQAELQEKFGIPAQIVEDKFWKKELGRGTANPFNPSDANRQVLICSYNFAVKHAAELAAVSWDLVVCDEAHRLRGLSKSSGNKIAQALHQALNGRRKLLLTATPLQNDLMELWSLVSLIDPHLLGSKESFRAQFIGSDESPTQLDVLREQLKSLCKRTLRRDVQQYIRFTKRKALLFEYTPSKAEHQLYTDVSDFLRREDSVALPRAQRHLMTMILRKLLASSSFAIADTLQKMLDRLKEQDPGELNEIIENDFDTFGELKEEWADEVDEAENLPQARNPDKTLLAEETRLLEDIIARAQHIEANSKGNKLLLALQEVFQQAEASKAARKAVIFTESTRTQRYLYELLESNGYAGQVVLISGQNKDERAKQILKSWKERHHNSELLRRDEAINLKAALVEEFRDRGTILVATESAAEGINLQFCSLVVNYDLPWNPQRIEQRIGRCHRYGQVHDVVVVNFLNVLNEADRRVYELLEQKFKLFEGVFGSSDEVLGAVESGIDIEKRIGAIYQNCRTSEEISRQFDELQASLDAQLKLEKEKTRQAILDHFDESVAERLAVHNDRLKRPLDQRQNWLLNLLQHEKRNEIVLTDDGQGFTLGDQTYHLDWRIAEARDLTHFHEQHELAQQLIEQAQLRPLSPQQLTFNYAASNRKISALELRRGQSGWLQIDRLRYDFQSEPIEYLLLACVGDADEVWDEELTRDLLNLPATAEAWTGEWPESLLKNRLDELQKACQDKIEERNEKFLDEEIEKISFWEENQLAGFELKIKELEKKIKQASRDSVKAKGIEKIELQKTIRDYEAEKRVLRNRRDQEEERIKEQRNQMIDEAESRIKAQGRRETRVQVRWVLV